VEVWEDFGFGGEVREVAGGGAGDALEDSGGRVRRKGLELSGVVDKSGFGEMMEAERADDGGLASVVVDGDEDEAAVRGCGAENCLGGGVR
jgi:hypothetical protein